MGAVCDFYIECAEKDCVPIERYRDTEMPPTRFSLKNVSVQTRRGSVRLVTGISVADAIEWANSGDAPAYVASFLETFAWCEVCAECGCVGQPHYFAMSGHGERFCVDCA